MPQYLARARAWRTVLGHRRAAAELNPVEQIWGNIEGRELANLCPVSILALRATLRAELRPHPSRLDPGLRLRRHADADLSF